MPGGSSGTGQVSQAQQQNDPNKKNRNPSKDKSSKIWTAEQELKFSSFDAADASDSHSFHSCKNRTCKTLSSMEVTRLNEQSIDRFQHQWIMDDDLTYSSNTGVNWLMDRECFVCSAENMAHQITKTRPRSITSSQQLDLNGKRSKIMPIHNNTQQPSQQSFSAECQLLKKKWVKLKMLKMKFTTKRCLLCNGLRKRKSPKRSSRVFWNFFSKWVLKISSISNTVQLVQSERCFFSLVALWKHSWYMIY